MNIPDVSQAACAHSIVMRSLVSAGSTIYPDAVKDAWHCCDCGTRFLPHGELPTFPLEKSHLHVKLEHVTLANARLRERVYDTVPRSRYDACNSDWLIEKDRADRISALAAAHIKTLEVERDTLRGWLSECEKDAKRYRWLRDAPTRMWKRLAEETVEATESAIDAAIAWQGEEKP